MAAAQLLPCIPFYLKFYVAMLILLSQAEIMSSVEHLLAAAEVQVSCCTFLSKMCFLLKHLLRAPNCIIDLCPGVQLFGLESSCFLFLFLLVQFFVPYESETNNFTCHSSSLH